MTNEPDCVRTFEQRLLTAGIISETSIKKIWEDYEKEAFDIQQIVKAEPGPNPEAIWEHIYAGNENAN